MAKLYIPQVGDKLKLSANWDCKVFNERRNSKVFSGLNIDVKNQPNSDIDVTFPKGTVLRVDRLYVRAPASSYDSITFTVDSSPIKSLNKARFWVKLMTANTIEFEEVNVTMDSHEKIKSLYRYVALKNDYQNSERLSDKERHDVCKEIYEYFLAKENKEIVFKLNISYEELYYSLAHEDKWRWRHRNEDAYDKYYADCADRCRNLVNDKNSQLIIKVIPVLDGWVYYYSTVEAAVEYDKEIDCFNKYEKTYWKNQRLGSYLSQDNFFCLFNKKEFPKYVVSRLDDLSKLEITYQGNPVTLKNSKDFQKFLKQARG